MIEPRDFPGVPATHQIDPGLQPSNTVHANPFFRVHDRAGYFSVDYTTPVVGVLACLGDRIVLCRVKRVLLDATPWELPAGAVDPGETPVEGARRELREESGIAVDDLGRFMAMPSYAISPRHPVLPYAYRVVLTQAEWDQRRPHDDEVCEVRCFSRTEVANMIVKGQIWMSETITMLARVLLADYGILTHV